MNLHRHKSNYNVQRNDRSPSLELTLTIGPDFQLLETHFPRERSAWSWSNFSLATIDCKQKVPTPNLLYC